jgi:RNA polymerase-binding transcription factor DksA
MLDHIPREGNMDDREGEMTPGGGQRGGGPGAGDQDVDTALRARLEDLERLKRFEEETTFEGDQRDTYGELSMVDQHPADVADQLHQREMNATLIGVLDQQEQQVREALERRAQGTYGICARCGREISAERLQARPEATLCIDCQREVEAGH